LKNLKKNNNINVKVNINRFITIPQTFLYHPHSGFPAYRCLFHRTKKTTTLAISITAPATAIRRINGNAGVCGCDSVTAVSSSGSALSSEP
jgi:hypothetical protein